jgi:hypothetical protein
VLISTEHITRIRGKRTFSDTLAKQRISFMEMYAIDATKHYDPFQL